MSEIKVEFFNKPWLDANRVEPSTCTEAETFVLQVRDDSMEPEFKSGCIIVIDPTGHATEGSYVLARREERQVASEAGMDAGGSSSDAGSQDDAGTEVEKALQPYVFRQLRCDDVGVWRLCPLNDTYPSKATASDFSEIVGVIVQRAGTRRRYHKRYD